jgi:prepilin-type processing-associated H-X9-DG protein
LEEQALADRFNFALSITRQPTNPQAEFIASFLCPSENANGRLYELPGFPSATRLAKGNYAAYVSPFHVDLQLLFPGALVVGGQRMASVVDGTSNTVAFSEVRTLDLTNDERGAWALPWTGASLLAFDIHPSGWPDDHDGTAEGDTYVIHQQSYTINRDSLGEGQPPNNQGPNADTLKACIENSAQRLTAAAQLMPCTQAHPPGLNGYMSAAPRSNHPGGVNAAWLDGSVNWIADSIDQELMAYLVAINDGQSVSVDGM